MATAPRTALLWTLTVVLVAAAIVYQRRTGPTYPYRTTVTVARDERVAATLIRSAETTGDADVIVPSPGGAVSGTMFWRRYPTTDDWQATPLVPRTGEGGAIELVGRLPRQAPAGKLEYRLELVNAAGLQRIPAAPNADGDHLVMRFKDPVPAAVLVPHVVLMFLSLLLGLRAGLGALLGADGWQRYVGVTAVCMTFGGMVFGPVVQKYAFGAYWAGFPVGSDWTDNKMLAQWIGWLLTWLATGTAAVWLVRWRRPLAIVTTLIMLSVYLIPHSMRGSELDYAKLDQMQKDHGTVDPRTAIGTSDK